MRKLYISPTVGRSCDLPPEISHFLMEEPCHYRMTCSESQLEGLDPDTPKGLIETFQDGTEKVKEVVRTIYGIDETYVSWDAPGVRFYAEIDDFEEDLDALMAATGLRLTLDCRDRDTPRGEEWAEIIYGFPLIDGNDRCAELETE